MYFTLYSTTPGNILGRSSGVVLEARDLAQLGRGVDDEPGKAIPFREREQSICKTDQ